jgi:hypothetical protein
MNKRNIIISLGVGLLILMVYKSRKGKAKNGIPNSGGGDGSQPLTPIETISTKYLGKGAYAISDSTFVRNDSFVNNSSTFDPINNIVGVLSKDEFAGIIEKMVIGKNDGKYWYFVNKGQNFNCPFGVCGITFPTKKGWVRSDVVTIK